MSTFNEVFVAKQLGCLVDDPMEALETCRDAYSQIDETHSIATSNLIAFITGYVNRISADREEKDELFNHRFWGDTRDNIKERNLSLTVARFVLGAQNTGSRSYERARRYAKVVDHYMRLEMEPLSIAQHLQTRSIEAVLEEVSESKKATEPAAARPSPLVPQKSGNGGRPERQKTPERRRRPAIPTSSRHQADATDFSVDAEANKDDVELSARAIREPNESEKFAPPSVKILLGDFAEYFDNVGRQGTIDVRLLLVRHRDPQIEFEVVKVLDRTATSSRNESRWENTPRRRSSGGHGQQSIPERRPATAASQIPARRRRAAD